MQIFSGISWSGAWLHWFTRCFSEFRWPIEPHGGSRAPSSGRGPRCSALSSALQYVSIDRSCWMKTDEELYSSRHWPIWSVRLVDAFLDSRPQVAKDTIAKVHTVQHSNWNEQQTHSSELNYVKANTDYIRIKVMKPMKHGMELDGTCSFFRILCILHQLKINWWLLTVNTCGIDKCIHVHLWRLQRWIYISGALQEILFRRCASNIIEMPRS